MSADSEDPIRRFTELFNSIDGSLRRLIGVKRGERSFPWVIDTCVRGDRSWMNDAEFLKMIGRLRNVIVHEPTVDFEMPAIPTHSVLERMRRIEHQLAAPITAIQAFQKTVEIVAVTDSLAHVWS